MRLGLSAKKIAMFLRGKPFYHTVTEIYKPGVSSRVKGLLDSIKEKKEIASKSVVGQKLKVAKEYFKLEMAPPKFNEAQQMKEDLELIKEFIQNRCYNYITVRQAWLLFLVGVEIITWFFMGEVIGKMHYVGYEV